MNSFTLGVKNAFRNTIRSLAIIVILGLSIGLSLTMLLAHQAVGQKINSVKSSIGNTISITPAGFSAFSQANNALTASQLAKVSTLAHVTNVTETLTGRLTTIGSSGPAFFGNSNSNSSDQTSLTSPTQINISRMADGSFGGLFINGGGSLPTNFTPPVTIIGTNNPTQVNSTNLTISSGQAINGSSNTNEAMVSKSMASKNNLKVGSTFTAYGTKLTLQGIFSGSTKAENGDIIVSLPTEQRLSGQTSDVTSATVTVDSLDNLNSTTDAIKSQLGSSADITNAQQQADNAIAPLNSVKSISLYSLIGAVVAGAVIIFLVMIMIVRERRREIGVLKAIGASTFRIVKQFISEAVTLTVLGAVIGLIIGVVGGTPVTNLLVNNSSSTPSSSGVSVSNNSGGPTAFVRGGGFGGRFRNNSVIRGASNIHAAVGWNILIYGFGAAVVIAVVGSSLASGLIAKVRPSEVMRAE